MHHATALTFLLLLANAFSAHAADSESRVLLRNASMILTMEPELGEGRLGILQNQDILVYGDSITAIGHQLDADDATVIDASGKIIMPGFISIHDHLFQAVMRGCGDGENIGGWLDKCIYPLYGDLITEEDAYAGVRFGALELINSGITTVADWSSAFSKEFIRGNLQALEDSGLRFSLAYKVTKVTPALINDIHAIKKRIDSNSLATMQLSPVPSTKEPLFTAVKAMADMAKDMGVQLHVHLHEGINDRKHGQLDSLIKANALGPGLLAAHAVHLNDEEIKLLAKHNVRLAHCPISNMRTGSGVMRLPGLLETGILVGFGVDGGAVSNGNMFELMRTAVGLQRTVTGQASTTPDTTQALLMATVNGAKALGLDAQAGSLKAGKKADMIILNPDGINLIPVSDLPMQIVFYGQPWNVDTVLVNGRFLKRNGRLLVNDMDDIQKTAQHVADKIQTFLENQKTP